MAPTRSLKSPGKRKLPRWISWWIESPFHEIPPIPKLAAWSFIILTSPVWIPIFLVTLPSRIIRDRREKREAAIRAEMAAKIPKESREPVDPELVRRRQLARRTNTRKHPRIHFLYDPINDDPAFAWAIKEAGQRVDDELGPPVEMGSCHRRWRRKKEILKDEFGVDWFTPSEMNPGARFD